MRTLSDLANVLIGCRIVSRTRWERAARAGGDYPVAVLDALTAHPPEWYTAGAGDTAEVPPGLTEYQRGVIDLWLEGDETPIERQLTVNQFLLLDKLGEGGQGEVYRGRQLNPARFVAVKTLTRDTETSRARFEQEARAMMKIQHPGVARFYLYERVRDEDNNPTNEYLIAMELVDGTDLHRLVRWSGPVPWPFAVKWAIDLLGGLAVVHQNGFIHRDVKPANVIPLGPPPEAGTRPNETAAKLLDLGAVGTVEGATGSKSGRRIFVGTREYAPPEQWAERVVPASDLYALGGTLFYALTGRPPYEVEGRDAVAFMKAHSRAPIPSATDFNSNVPQELSWLLQRMMAKRADDRGTATELIAEFRELLPADDAPARSAKPVRRSKSAQAAPIQAPRPIASASAEPRGPLDRVFGPVLTVFERVFLPAHLRPTPGPAHPFGERVASLVRRPLVLVVFALIVALFVFWIVR